MYKACARVTAHGVSQCLLCCISFFHSFSKYSPIFALSWHLLSCRGYSFLASIPGYLNGCLKAFWFLSSRALVPAYCFPRRNLACDPSLLLYSSDQFHGLNVQGCVLLFYQIAHCWNDPLTLSWPWDAVFSKGRSVLQVLSCCHPGKHRFPSKCLASNGEESCS